MVEYTGWDSHIVTDTNIATKLDFIIKNKQRIPHDRFHWVRRILKDNSYNIALDEFHSSQYADEEDFDTQDRDNDTYCWLLDEYQPGDYSGEGQRIGIRRSDGKLVYGFTSHCSCNGPWEDGSDDLVTAASTNKLLDMDINNLTGIDWGDQFIKNVNWLYDYIVEASRPRPYIPMSVSGSTYGGVSGTAICQASSGFGFCCSG